jgi:hypothetical protein
MFVSACSVVDFVKKSVVYMASHELHVCATFSRGFFWTDLNLWPEDLAQGSVVLLSGRDDLMNARQVQAMLEPCGHIKVSSWETCDQVPYLLAIPASCAKHSAASF